MSPTEAQTLLRELAGLQPAKSLPVGSLTPLAGDSDALAVLVATAVSGLSRGSLRRWRASVVDRDKTCVMCDDDRNLEAHHCRPKSMFPELAYDVANGVLLCYRCHRVIVHGSNTWDLNNWQRFMPLWPSLQRREYRT